MRKSILISIIFFVGCVGSSKPRHPYQEGRSAVRPWWTTPYTAETPRNNNPWLTFVYPLPNEFDPWANDDLQRYNVKSATVPGSIIPITTEHLVPNNLPKGKLY
jgi:hypothetical protein